MLVARPVAPELVAMRLVERRPAARRLVDRRKAGITRGATVAQEPAELVLVAPGLAALAEQPGAEPRLAETAAPAETRATVAMPCPDRPKAMMAPAQPQQQ
jgi:hypothetical protein